MELQQSEKKILGGSFLLEERQTAMCSPRKIFRSSTRCRQRLKIRP